MEKVAIQIVELLRTELPTALLYKADDIEMLIKRGKNREAYLKMYELKKNIMWSPTEKYLQLMEKFWWKYAN